LGCGLVLWPEELIKMQAPGGYVLLRRLWSCAASSSELHKQPHRKGWTVLEFSAAYLDEKPSIMKIQPGIESVVGFSNCFLSCGFESCERGSHGINARQDLWPGLHKTGSQDDYTCHWDIQNQEWS
jgi:hypothetical protein